MLDLVRSKLLAFCDNVYLDFALLPIADIAISIPGIYSPMYKHTHTFTYTPPSMYTFVR